MCAQAHCPRTLTPQSLAIAKLWFQKKLPETAPNKLNSASFVAPTINE
jgi:hypothetical protein